MWARFLDLMNWNQFLVRLVDSSVTFFSIFFFSLMFFSTSMCASYFVVYINIYHYPTTLNAITTLYLTHRNKLLKKKIRSILLRQHHHIPIISLHFLKYRSLFKKIWRVKTNYSTAADIDKWYRDLSKLASCEIWVHILREGKKYVEGYRLGTCSLQ